MSQLDSFTVDQVFGCHLWFGKVGSNGRPIVWRGKSPMNVYRVVYEERYGPIKTGLVVDHLCRRITCVWHVHLEAVTQHENLLRKSWAYRARRKLCSRGHTLATALVTPEMGRLCRSCQRDAL